MLQPTQTWNFLLKPNTLFNPRGKFIKLTYFNLGKKFYKSLFSDRLLYVGKGNDQMNKSKSMGYLKVGNPMISPVYQLNSSSQI